MNPPQPSTAVQYDSKRATELKKMADDVDTVFPTSLITYLLETNGCEVADESVKKLVAIELQQYLLDILADVRTKAEKASVSQSKKLKLETDAKDTPDLKLDVDNLERVLKARNVEVSRAPYHPL